MKEKLVSVIVPCYNMQKYLNNCFYCLDNQTYKNVEIILVDDGSKDSTPQMLDDYCMLNSKAKVVHKTNGGLSSARNAGLEVASGDYIYFYDTDDILSKDIIETLVNTMESSSAQYAIGYCKKINDGDRLTRFVEVTQRGNKIKTLSPCETFSLMTNDYKIFSSVWNKLYVASIINDNNLRFDEKCLYGEDTSFNYAYLMLIDKVAIINKILYYYVQRKNSLIHQKFKETRLSVFPTYNRIIESETNDLTPYIHLMRLYSTVECLYFIKKSDYADISQINTLLDYLKEDLKFVKQCKHVKLYRKIFLPCVPKLSKCLLKKRLQPQKSKEAEKPNEN